jgi:hypothetical protein
MSARFESKFHSQFWYISRGPSQPYSTTTCCRHWQTATQQSAAASPTCCSAPAAPSLTCWWLGQGCMSRESVPRQRCRTCKQLRSCGQTRSTCCWPFAAWGGVWGLWNERRSRGKGVMLVPWLATGALSWLLCPGGPSSLIADPQEGCPRGLLCYTHKKAALGDYCVTHTRQGQHAPCPMPLCELRSKATDATALTTEKHLKVKYTWVVHSGDLGAAEACGFHAPPRHPASPFNCISTP